MLSSATNSNPLLSHRSQLPFEGIEKLVEAIKNDIVVTEDKCGDFGGVGIKEEVDWCKQG